MLPGFHALRDTDLRQALRRTVLAPLRRNPQARVLTELDVGRARVDVVTVHHELVGYEIKSDVDSLHRLPNQIEYYNRVLDRSSLVTTERHLAAAQRLLPPEWGILLADFWCRGVQLHRLRPAQRNPHLRDYELARLLWRTELLATLREVDALAGIQRQCCAVLRQRLVEVLSLPQLRAVVRRCFKQRPWWHHTPAVLCDARTLSFQYRVRHASQLTPNLPAR